MKANVFPLLDLTTWIHACPHVQDKQVEELNDNINV